MRFLKDSQGFTIIEIIALLLIIGVLSAVAISRVSATNTYNLDTEVETLKAHLRFAQARALSHEDSWGIRLETGQYTLLKNGIDAGATYKLPNESSDTYKFSGGVSKTSGAATVIFDKWGSPGTSDQTITLSNGTDSRLITITKNTGFIP